MSAWGLSWGASWGASWGLDAITVPNVVGETFAYATEVITDADLTITVTYAYSATLRAGLVISQSPAAGAVAESGDAIALVISSNPVTGAQFTSRNSSARFQ